MPKCNFNSRSAISIKLQSNKFIEITLRHGYSSVNLLHACRIRFLKNTSGRLILNIDQIQKKFR